MKTFAQFEKGAVLRSGVATVALGLALLSAPAFAQDAADEAEGDLIVVTGSRIARPNLEANSPINVVTGDATIARGDVTLDTFLNTLPGVNPAGTTTSNNPPNGGQSNIDLRGLGPNRNLVLVDGRRPMVSASDQTVDLNTIPQPLIERVEVITGGAGAAYGADAVAGVVNLVMKRDFTGLDLRASYTNSLPKTDAREYQLSATAGMNFGPDDRGNIVLSYEHAGRQGLIKAQRNFASVATATTSFLPEGLYAPGTDNAPTQASVDAYFAQFGAAAGSIPRTGSLIGFNLDGSMFSRGTFNNPRDVVNFKYPIDGSVNTNLYPDVYSYNFDIVNILTLPLKRDSAFGRARYDLTDNLEVFVQGNYTKYTSATALAPTPVPTVGAESLTGIDAQRVKTNLIETGQSVTSNQLIVPVTNPFIPAAFKALLASRTGDNAALVGSGATEPFLMRHRTLSIGTRNSVYANEVYQILGGLKYNFGNDWRMEAYVSEGRTTITESQTGNVDTQKLQDMLQAADGGASKCAGGYNPFGRQPLSAECIAYLEVKAKLQTKFKQRIAQAFVSGPLAELPAGDLAVVAGVEYRKFSYDFNPGALAGPVSGFSAQDPAGGTNRFVDVFGEVNVPILKDSSFAKSLELNLGFRYSDNKVRDIVKNLNSGSGDWAYKAELSYAPIDVLRLRATYQRSVRAPNFGELFDGGGDAPQYFDPCSITSTARTTGSNAAKISSLCETGNSTAAAVKSNITVAPGYVQTPGTQIALDVTGNSNLKPEKADTFTLGVVASGFGGGLSRLRASLDYYNIKISDVILQPDPNLIVANCYNYFGNNPSYSGDNANCGYIGRAGGDILGFGLDFGDLPYQGTNAGYIKTSGLDLQLSYGFDTRFIGEESGIDVNVLLNHVFEYKTKELADQPAIDYAGTVSVFGATLGGSVPKWKANVDVNFKLNDKFSLNSRARFIDGMVNRYSRIYIGEKSFTNVPSVWYFDFGAEMKIDGLTLRAGLNNAFDKQPPRYAPNVQSGTDPSLYDVIGRRFYVSANVKF